MIIPSIDLMNGQAVQLIGGEKKALDAGDPIPLAEKFRLAGEIAVIDLDAAMGQGDNRALIKKLIRVAPCRVGGGIRDVKAALSWLDEGARKVILGTQAVPKILKELPKDRVIAALDNRDGEVVVEGWKKKTGMDLFERLEELHPLVSGILVTFVEKEGRMKGTKLDQVEAIVKAAGKARVTIAGGITKKEEIKALDQMGADAQVGMALYTGKLDFADAICAPLRSDREDGLWPTIVTDEQEIALGLCYSNAESVREAVRTQRGVYHSRSRGLWLKGESSGAIQKLLRVDLDCDRDTLRFIVTQEDPGFCHLHTRTCFGEDEGLASLARKLRSRLQGAPKGSYTKKLLKDPKLLRAKLLEEAGELASAKTKSEVIWEAADLIYFALVAMTKAKVSVTEVEKELQRRTLKVTRRPGLAKK